MPLQPPTAYSPAQTVRGCIAGHTQHTNTGNPCQARIWAAATAACVPSPAMFGLGQVHAVVSAVVPHPRSARQWWSVVSAWEAGTCQDTQYKVVCVPA